ncbi:MAG TPA: GNAT family N-acetyltransferase [Acidimicrobiales bacterium]|nr:GNAT family N-acetyltransferase [Acidimicrobiales bacterium]
MTVEIRRASPDDLPAVLALAQASLGWRAGDPNDAFFRWKHLDNPAGVSPMWVAFAGDRLAGFRTFLRWRFRVGDARTAVAVRAVDTATHPEFQGQGVFTRLTLGALDELAAEGVEFVFNTPNDQSRPGYLKMGWQVVGRVPISMRPRGPLATWRSMRSRVAAEKWSVDTPAGMPAEEALADDHALDRLLAASEAAAAGSPGASTAIATDRTPAHLRWRYRFGPLHYRAVVSRGGPASGLAVFRVRRRGASTEAVLCELLAPDDGAALVEEIARTTRADYVIAAGRTPAGARLVPVPRQGPILTWRAVVDGAVAPPLSDWRLTMGDVELL